MNLQVIEEVTLSPQRRLWTADEFVRAGELDLFGPEERLELIEGEIISKVVPQSCAHATGIVLTSEALHSVSVSGYHVRSQVPMSFGPMSLPEPDISMVSGRIRDYATHHPTTAALIVEVADSSLRLDRHAKASLYARAGVADYWIVNIPDRGLEVHRDPVAMEDQPYGYHYRSITRHGIGDTASPLIAAERNIPIADLLP